MGPLTVRDASRHVRPGEPYGTVHRAASKSRDERVMLAAAMPGQSSMPMRRSSESLAWSI